MPYADIEKERERQARRRKTPEYRAYQRKYSPTYYKANKEKFRGWNFKHRLAHPERYLLAVARDRARKRGIAFEIDESDIVIPATCPVLGIPIFMKQLTHSREATPNSPSLDRIRPHLGYVKGNVQVISWRANNIKRDATPEELRLVADFVNRQDV